MKKLLISRPLPDAVMSAARKHFDVVARKSVMPMSRAEMLASLRDFDAVLPTLGDRYSAEVLEAAGRPRAKILANFGVGFNHIDTGAASAAGLIVTNTPGAVTEATADIGMMLMLMACRRASEGERAVRRGQWTGWHPMQFLGTHLGGKVLGVVGMGRIGKAIAKRAALGFGMKVVFFNRSEVADPGVEAEQVASLHDLAAKSDVVIVAVPATPATHHLIDGEFLAAMKPEGYLVNIARGDIVDEAALIAALDSGLIAGAGLDVYENEPEVPEALRAMENVSLLPHLGTATLEVRTGMGLMAVENLIAWDEGRAPPNRVN